MEQNPSPGTGDAISSLVATDQPDLLTLACLDRARHIVVACPGSCLANKFSDVSMATQAREAGC